MNRIYILHHERATSPSFQCTVYILKALKMPACRSVNCRILLKANDLRLMIYASYLWEMALNVGVDASFCNMHDRKGLREKIGEFPNADASITNYDFSLWILKGI
jgi:hypothetical protein